MDLVQYLGGGSATNQPHGFVAGSDVLSTMTPAAANSIVAAISAWPNAAGTAHVLIDPLNGATGDIDAAGSAFPWRGYAAAVQRDVDTPDAATMAAASRWISTAHAAVAPYSAGRYVNSVEENTSAARYYAGNLSRLTSTRQKYDPVRLMFSGLSF
jgi:hypothetical protein